MSVSTRLQAVQNLYQQLNRERLSLQLLATVYDIDVHFHDPLHDVHGLKRLYDYFVQMYASVESIRFQYGSAISDGARDFQPWVMYYRHPALAGGREIEVSGGSVLEWRHDHIVRHQDLFDAGQMLYEHVPVLGHGIRLLRRRLS